MSRMLWWFSPNTPEGACPRCHGMGLTIAKEIIDAHDGHISVFSEAGKGAKFMVEIPSF